MVDEIPLSRGYLFICIMQYVTGETSWRTYFNKFVMNRAFLSGLH